VPDDAAAPVAVRAGGLDRRLDGGPVLVVLLGQPGRLVGVDDERAQQVQQPALVEHTSSAGRSVTTSRRPLIVFHGA
jgi:hypothetical protein